jgi:hypothetical protein
MHALMPLPPQLSRFIRLPASEESTEVIRFIRLETVVGIFVSRLFPGYRVRSQGAFRVLRDSDIEVQEEAVVADRETVAARAVPEIACSRGPVGAVGRRDVGVDELLAIHARRIVTQNPRGCTQFANCVEAYAVDCATA